MSNTIRVTLQVGQKRITPYGAHRFIIKQSSYTDVENSTETKDGLSENAIIELETQFHSMVARLKQILKK